MLTAKPQRCIPTGIIKNKTADKSGSWNGSLSRRVSSSQPNDFKSSRKRKNSWLRVWLSLSLSLAPCVILPRLKTMLAKVYKHAHLILARPCRLVHARRIDALSSPPSIGVAGMFWWILAMHSTPRDDDIDYFLPNIFDTQTYPLFHYLTSLVRIIFFSFFNITKRSSKLIEFVSYSMALYSGFNKQYGCVR